MLFKAVFVTSLTKYNLYFYNSNEQHTLKRVYNRQIRKEGQKVSPVGAVIVDRMASSRLARTLGTGVGCN